MLETNAMKHNLGAYTELLKTLSAPCMLGLESGQPQGLGCSKVGGHPHVDQAFIWPKYQGKSLAFIAQLNLTELKDSQLPDQGLLLFFYANGLFADKRQQKDFIRVIHIKDSSHLAIKEPDFEYKKRLFGLLKPKSVPQVFAEHAIKFCEGVSLPDLDNVENIPQLSTFDDNDELLDAYCDLKWGLVDQAVLQIGGFPNPVQHDGMAAGAAAIMVKGSADDWQLLLEVDSQLGFMWGDAGRLYFYIHKDDLKTADFSNVWMEFQCH